MTQKSRGFTIYARNKIHTLTSAFSASGLIEDIMDLLFYRCRETVSYNSVELRQRPEYAPMYKYQIRDRYGINQEDILLCNLGMSKS